MSLTSLVHDGRIWLASVAICSCTCVVAQDVPVTVTLADYSKWCTPIVLTAEAANNEATQQTARAAAVRKMDALLLKSKAQSSGYPFIANVKKFTVKDNSGKNVDSISMDICYVVDPATPNPPSGTVVATRSTGERVAALVCARTSEEQCIDRLQSALADTALAVPMDTVKSWPWRYVATLDVPVGAAAIALALTATGARPIRGDVAVTVFGDIKLPNPKVMRPLAGKTTGNVITVPAEQGQWFVTAVSLP